MTGDRRDDPAAVTGQPPPGEREPGERETGESAPAQRPPGRARDRDVLVLMTGVVVAVLAANLLSAAVPGLDLLLAGAPVLVLLLLAVTALVLLRTLRRPGR